MYGFGWLGVFAMLVLPFVENVLYLMSPNKRCQGATGSALGCVGWCLELVKTCVADAENLLKPMVQT